MNGNRRGFLQRAMALGAGGWALQRQNLPGHAMESPDGRIKDDSRREVEREKARSAAQPAIIAPDLPKLAWKLENGVKVFHLVAEPVKQELIPGKTLDLWGYNGTAPGPLIEANQGDRLRIIFDNHLPEPTAIHWHGLEVPNNMDGVPGITQPYILPGKRFIYEFTLHQEGTYFYHSHMAMQEMLGMIGPLILHPRKPYSTTVDRDFVIVLQEYAALPTNPVPNTMSMEFNWLTMNGKSGPATTPLVIRHGERVKVRLINLGMDAHPIHLHGMQFWITGTEGGRQPESNWIRRNTVLVGVAQAFDVEFEATNPGEWMLHCHLPHHMMNQMASNVGPMTRTAGLPTGLSMDNGMGMLQQGAAGSQEYGASLGRGMGISSRYETPVGNGKQRAQSGGSGQARMGNMPGMAPMVKPAQTAMPGMAMGQSHGMQLGAAIAPNANQVPGFPQDVFMEGPEMNMDKAVAKPETYGLPAGWSGFIQGMMTLVRVLPPEMFDKIEQLQREAGRRS